jgi:hypothetical protein
LDSSSTETVEVGIEDRESHCIMKSKTVKKGKNLFGGYFLPT